MTTKNKEEKIISVAVNRQARFEFFISETFEAGIELLGSEVKSIRDGGVNLKEGFAHIERNQLVLEGVHISPYSHANQQNHAPIRTRRLLLHRREIDRIAAELSQKGLTLVPLRLYFKNGWAKIELGLAKGKKLHDKRESIKKDEARRTMDRAQKIRRLA